MNAEPSGNDEAVIVRLRLSDDEFGEWAEREAAYAIEDRLIELFESAHLGEFNGHEFGGGFATLYMYGPSAEAMATAVLPVLAEVSHRQGSSLTKRFGPPGSPEQTTPLSRGAAQPRLAADCGACKHLVPPRLKPGVRATTSHPGDRTALTTTRVCMSHLPRPAHGIRVIVAMTLLVALTDGAAQPVASAPPAAFSVGAAFDVGRNRLVVFGGFFRGQYFGDTWEWDGHTWTRSEEPGPSPRNSPQIVYDEARRRLLLFGGDTRADGALGDTWERDAGTWRRVATSGPPPRTVHAMVYDSDRKRVVLFGGAAAGEVLGDTWEWDGGEWTHVASGGPLARALHGLAYDAGRRRVVLFGGTRAIAPDAQTLGDTWEWDGRAWAQLKIPGPSARDHTAMAYDVARRVIVLHGGGAGPDDRAETWTFDGSVWRQVATSGPRRMNPKLVFDSSAKAVLLFGGFNGGPSNELWRFSGSAWERIAP